MTPALTLILTGAALFVGVSLIVIWSQAAMLRRRWQEVAEMKVSRDHWFTKASERAKALAVANARLAPFIAKRERDDKGHFLPTVRSEAA